MVSYYVVHGHGAQISTEARFLVAPTAEFTSVRGPAPLWSSRCYTHAEPEGGSKRARWRAAGGEVPDARVGETGARTGRQTRYAHVHVGRGAIIPSVIARWMNSVMIR